MPLAVRIVPQGTHTRRPNVLAAYRLVVEETVLLSKYYEPYTKDTNYKD